VGDVRIEIEPRLNRGGDDSRVQRRAIGDVLGKQSRRGYDTTDDGTA